MQAKTIGVDQIWQSSDGQRTIWEVTLKAEDKEYRLKTYSNKIATLGFTGEVRSYLNPRGERFVRQVPTNTKPAFKSSYQRDDYAIRAQWAIGQAINLASVKMDKDAITLPVIEKYAKELFQTVSRVKGEDVTAEERQAADSYIKGMSLSGSASAA